ncbi:MAG TPA: glycosyltransferase [Gemmataceae bacterium]|nr:glycosyltransferase [Gemmataceae bacterium]
MRILYVGNGNYKHRGQRYYDVGRKLMNGLIRNGHDVYFLSDRDTARAATVFRSRHLGVRHCNRVFIETCYYFRPDLILLGHADIISPASVKEACDILPSVRVAQFNVDPVFRPTNAEAIKSKLPYVDATFITTAGDILKRFAGQGGLVSYMPNPVDGSMEWPRCHERSDQPHDVFWAMRHPGNPYPSDPRFEIPLFIENSGKVSIDYHGMNGKPPLFDSRYYEAIGKARMGLNISAIRTWGHTPIASTEELYLYSSDRISHYMGSGLLTFTTRDNQLEDLFVEDEELVFFSDEDELLDKLLYFKAHDEARRAVAAAGWRQSHKHFNERLVAKYIVETAFRLALTEDYAWPTRTY